MAKMVVLYDNADRISDYMTASSSVVQDDGE